MFGLYLRSVLSIDVDLTFWFSLFLGEGFFVVGL